MSAFPEYTEIFINESLFPHYRGIWKKMKIIKGQTKTTPVFHDQSLSLCEIR